MSPAGAAPACRGTQEGDARQGCLCHTQLLTGDLSEGAAWRAECVAVQVQTLLGALGLMNGMLLVMLYGTVHVGGTALVHKLASAM